MKTIQEIKEHFNLPYHKNQIEYWGPVKSDLADAFLAMTNEFLKKYIVGVHSRHLKEIFSAFVELVQNVSEYNQEAFGEILHSSYLGLVAGKNKVQLATSNLVKEKDIPFIEGLLNELTGSSKEELKSKHREALLEGKSLGLIIILRMQNATFDFKIEKTNEGHYWLSIETVINYESTEN